MAFVPPARHLLRARDLADARFAEPLDVDDMAAAAGLSRAHFSREFRRAFGESPHAYLLTRRLERAAALLRNTDRLGRRDLPRRRATGRRLLHDQLQAQLRGDADAPTARPSRRPPRSPSSPAASSAPTAARNTARFEKTAGGPGLASPRRPTSTQGENDDRSQTHTSGSTTRTRPSPSTPRRSASRSAPT